MSVRTAWEIAALEDVRLAPSPRPRQPAPAPVRAAGLCLTLPGPPRTQALQTGEGPTHGWGRCPSAPGCSVACGPSPLPPAPALVGHRWAGTWVSLVPVPTPDPGESRGQSWGVHPAARSHPDYPQPWESWGDTPSCLWGGSCSTGTQSSPRKGSNRGPQLRPHCTPSWGGTCSSVSPETCWWGAGRTPRKVTDLRKAGLGGVEALPHSSGRIGRAWPQGRPPLVLTHPSPARTPLLPGESSPPLSRRCLVERPRTELSAS